MKVLALFFVHFLLASGRYTGKSENIGACIAGRCPSGFSCNNQLCVPAITTCANSIGKCIDGACPSGFACQNGKCCEDSINDVVKGPIGSCIAGRCPSGFFCKNQLCLPINRSFFINL